MLLRGQGVPIVDPTFMEVIKNLSVINILMVCVLLLSVPLIMAILWSNILDKDSSETKGSEPDVPEKEPEPVSPRQKRLLWCSLILTVTGAAILVFLAFSMMKQDQQFNASLEKLNAYYNTTIVSPPRPYMPAQNDYLELQNVIQTNSAGEEIAIREAYIYRDSNDVLTLHSAEGFNTGRLANMETGEAQEGVITETPSLAQSLSINLENPFIIFVLCGIAITLISCPSPRSDSFVKHISVGLICIGMLLVPAYFMGKDVSQIGNTITDLKGHYNIVRFDPNQYLSIPDQGKYKVLTGVLSTDQAGNTNALSEVYLYRDMNDMVTIKVAEKSGMGLLTNITPLPVQ